MVQARWLSRPGTWNWYPNDFFGALPWEREGAGEYPAVNSRVTDEEIVAVVRVPGVKAGDVEVKVEGETLTISGSRTAEATDRETWHRRERPTGRFARSFRLPYPVDASRVTAELKRGLLTVKLPRMEEDKPRRIQVTVA